MPDQNSEEESLRRLQKELYAKDEGPEITLRRKELSSLGRKIPTGSDQDPSEAPTAFEDVMTKRSRKRRQLYMILAGVVGLVVIFVVALLATRAFRSSRQVHEEQISITIQGPSDVVSGGEAEYRIAYKNDSRVNWESVEVVAQLPEGLHLSATEPAAEGPEDSGVVNRELVWRIGNVAEGQGGEVKVRGRLSGEEGAVAVIQAEVTLTPENFPSGRFSKKALLSSTISALPIQISVDAAQTAGSGERIRGVIHVQNLGAEALAGVVLTVAPAPGVELSLEDAEFSSGYDPVSGSWELSPIPSLGEVTRTIIFSVAGQPGEKRQMEITVGVHEPDVEGQANKVVYIQRRLTHVVAVSASELTITQVYNGSKEGLTVFPKGKVKGEVRYANIGTVGMRNAIVTLQFEGSGLDVESLDLREGAFDPRTNKITWTAASVPQLSVLQPGATGTLVFEFSVLPSDKFSSTEKNAALIGIATIDSQDLPTPVGQAKKVISDRAVLSIGTDLTLVPTAFYDDGRLGITSTGPVPPKVGQTTTYTVRLRLGSALNDAGEVKVTAVLPEGVDYTGKTVVSKGSAEFDDRSREVQWDIPLLEGGTGRTKPAEELYFQVGVTPGANLKNQTIPFVTRLLGEGQDQFIEERVTVEVKELPSTETASPGNGSVE